MDEWKLKPIYTTFDSVKIRLVNKVQFQNQEQPMEGQLPNALLAQLISDAETAVEQALRGRYKIPFQSCRTGRFQDLPDHSQRAIRRAIDQKAVLEVLSTDFGRGGNVSAKEYYDDLDERYKKYITELLGQDQEGGNDKHDRFRFTPPLDEVALALTNIADDGYRGTIINTDASEHDAVSYAEEQINNPSQSYLNRRLTNPAGG